MKIVFVAEAWGKSENLFRHPLVGASGRELSLQIGLSGLGPFMDLTCRKCASVGPFTGEGFCPVCGEYRWPSEFDLISYWKTLRHDHSIAVTNVFNEQPPAQCATCGSYNVLLNARPSCADCKSREIRTNDIGFFFGSDVETDLPRFILSKVIGGHLKRVHLHHLERLYNELRDFAPNVVIALGNTPCWALLGQTKISSLRGTTNWSEKLNLKVVPTYHPAGILRAVENRPDAIADLTKAAREAEFPEIRRLQRFITIPAPNQTGLGEIREWFTRPTTSYAVDIETVRRQITFISFARSPFDSISIPFRDCNSYNNKIVELGKVAKEIGYEPQVNFWPSAELEVEAWKLVIQTLESPTPKIFQNGIYDLSYLIKMGIHPRNCLHDTMLWHHARYPEKPKSLGYLGSLYAAEIPWKLMGRHQTLKRDE